MITDRKIVKIIQQISKACPAIHASANIVEEILNKKLILILYQIPDMVELRE